jgi:hypothetical protein
MLQRPEDLIWEDGGEEEISREVVAWFVEVTVELTMLMKYEAYQNLNCHYIKSRKNARKLRAHLNYLGFILYLRRLGVKATQS